MTLKWELMSSEQFTAAVQSTGGVCIIPIGVIEKHGQHLPLGTDLFEATRLAELATEIEPAVIFPPYYFTQILEAKHQPGTIAVDLKVMFDLLENVCREISRNGLKKILLLNMHGGNRAFLPFFSTAMLEKEYDFTLYTIDLPSFLPSSTEHWKSIRQTQVDGHAGEEETSLMMGLRPELVQMEKVVDDGMPMNRGKDLAGLETPIWWYADFPNHYAGDAHYASKEKGKYIVDHAVQRIAAMINAAKADDGTAKLIAEFHARAKDPTKKFDSLR